MLKLSNKWAPVLLAQPETGMGYQTVSLFLRDGRRFDRITVVGGTISEINGSDEIPFNEEEIVEVEVTHDR